MSKSFVKTYGGMALGLKISCDLSGVRPAMLSVRNFLGEQGLSEEEVLACEIALTEACNNAIRYVAANWDRESIEISATCDPYRVILCVYDHTMGFEWDGRAELPDNESERGRGLFLIQSLMDHTEYFRGKEENCFVMRKNRASPHLEDSSSHQPTVVELQHELTKWKQVFCEMAEELSSCYESLSAIFRYSSEPVEPKHLEDFSWRLMNDLLQITSADWFILRVVPKSASRLEVFTTSDPNLELPALDLLSFEKPLGSVELEAALTRQNVWFDSQKPLKSQDPLGRFKSQGVGLVHPFFFGDTLVGTITLGKTSSETQFTAAETNVMQTFAEFLAIKIINARVHEERVSNLLVARDLEIAKNIQRSLLLRTLPQLPGFRLAGYCESARQVGGDFYDVLKFTDHSVLLIIADVMGKGIPAAMFAAILRSLLRAMPHLINQPAALLTRVNRLLFEELSGVEMFITAQLVFVDIAQRKVITASAGHCPALLAVHGRDEVQSLSPDGMPLGILPDTTFVDEIAELNGKCRILMYTDGLPEARSPQGEVFGQKRLVDWLQTTTEAPGSAEDLKSGLVNMLEQFQQNTTLQDDQTFLLMVE